MGWSPPPRRRASARWLRESPCPVILGESDRIADLDRPSLSVEPDGIRDALAEAARATAEGAIVVAVSAEGAEITMVVGDATGTCLVYFPPGYSKTATGSLISVGSPLAAREDSWRPPLSTLANKRSWSFARGPRSRRARSPGNLSDRRLRASLTDAGPQLRAVARLSGLRSQPGVLGGARTPARNFRDGRKVVVQFRQSAARADTCRFVSEPSSIRLAQLMRPTLVKRRKKRRSLPSGDLEDANKGRLGEHVLSIHGRLPRSPESPDLDGFSTFPFSRHG